MATRHLVRRRLKLRPPADPARLGASGLWLGLAASYAGQRIANVERFVCRAHHDGPHLGTLRISPGAWWVDVEACCEALMADVEQELDATEA
jgi:hypothetical protein